MDVIHFSCTVAAHWEFVFSLSIESEKAFILPSCHSFGKGVCTCSGTAGQSTCFGGEDEHIVQVWSILGAVLSLF